MTIFLHNDQPLFIVAEQAFFFFSAAGKRSFETSASFLWHKGLWMLAHFSDISEEVGSNL